MRLFHGLRTTCTTTGDVPPPGGEQVARTYSSSSRRGPPGGMVSGSRVVAEARAVALMEQPHGPDKVPHVSVRPKGADDPPAIARSLVCRRANGIKKSIRAHERNQEQPHTCISAPVQAVYTSSRTSCSSGPILLGRRHRKVLLDSESSNKLTGRIEYDGHA